MNPEQNSITEIEKIEKNITSLNQEVKQLNQEINKNKEDILLYSTYNLDTIAKIIAKLITKFEGTEFIITSGIDWLYNEKELKIVSQSSKKHYQDLSFTLKEYVENDPLNPSLRNQNLLIPKGLMKFYQQKPNFSKYASKRVRRKARIHDLEQFFWRLSIPKHMPFTNPNYIDTFINELFQMRYKWELKEISEEQIFQFLDSFLSMYQSKIWKHQLERALYIEQEEAKYELKKHQNLCMIQRTPLINTITYLINHDTTSPYKIKNREESKWSRSSQWNTLQIYNVMDIIDNTSKKVILEYKSLHLKGGTYPDEEDFADIEAKENEVLDNQINFYEFFDKTKEIISKIPIANDFLIELEKYYKNNDLLTEDQILPVLIKLTNKKKEKRRILKKDVI